MGLKLRPRFFFFEHGKYTTEDTVPPGGAGEPSDMREEEVPQELSCNGLDSSSYTKQYRHKAGQQDMQLRWPHFEALILPRSRSERVFSWFKHPSVRCQQNDINTSISGTALKVTTPMGDYEHAGEGGRKGGRRGRRGGGGAMGEDKIDRINKKQTRVNTEGIAKK
jgi:hypothetical protein